MTWKIEAEGEGMKVGLSSERYACRPDSIISVILIATRQRWIWSPLVVGCATGFYLDSFNSGSFSLYPFEAGC